MGEEVVDGGDGFRISARQVDPDVLLVAVAGDLDVLTVAQTTAFLTRTAESAPRHLILDLSEVTFLTSSGIGLLIAVSENETYGRLHLLGVLDNRSVQRPLASVGLLGLFDVAPDLDTLLARLRTVEPSPD
jgi:anti-sigma B factor antagonist